MRRRRRQKGGEDSSLELLLDTICNTFGGILFIALLVIIILQTTTPKRNPVPESNELDMVNADNERSRLTAELTRLQKMIKENRDLEKTVTTPEILAMSKEWREEKARQRDALKKKSETIGKLTKIQKEINKIAKSQQEDRVGLILQQKRADALKKKLDDLIRKRSKKAIMPKEEKAGTTMSAKTCFLKKKSVYFDLDPRPSGSETVIVEKSNSGYSLSPSQESRLRSRLKDFYPDRHYLHIFVWPDSFESFEAFREILDDMGIKYLLVPMKADDKVYRGKSRSGQKIQGG